jgi:phosphoglucosamine mutase
MKKSLCSLCLCGFKTEGEIMPRFFGTDGIRSKAGEFPLETRALAVLGRALAELLNRRLERPASALIGRDTRESGDWIEAALATGLKAGGANISSAGVITTPGVAYLTREGGFDIGIVISASHNPYQDNGIKLFTPSGKKLEEDDEELLEEQLLDTSLSVDLPATPLEPVAELGERYYRFLRDEIASGLDLRGIKLCIDCANGASSVIAPRLFADLGAQVETRGCSPDGRNINEKCGSLHIDALQSTVLERGFDLGIAFDGDADRSLFVNERGELVDGDQVLYIMAGHYLRNNLLDPKLVVATVMSNVGLEVALRGLGVELRRTPVGDKNVLDELLGSSGIVGGEQSGHIIFPKISLAGDGLITALQVLRVMVSQFKSLSALTAGFETYPQILLNVPVKSKPAFDSVPAIQSAVDEVEQMLEGQGRLLLRYSGTEKLARVMIEGRNQAFINEQAERLAGIIRQQLG